MPGTLFPDRAGARLEHPHEPERLLDVVDAEEERVPVRGALSAATAQAASDSGRRSEAGLPETGPRKALREAPRTIGTPSGARSERPARRAKFCSGVLPKPSPGIEEDPVGPDPGDEARGGGPARGLPPRRRRRRRRTARRRTSSPGRPSCGSGRSRRPLAATRSRSPPGGSSPVTRLTTSAPAARARRATSVLRVSTETGIDALEARIPSTTGTTRASSSSTGTSPAPPP